MMTCQSIAVIITFYVITNGVINKLVLHIYLLIRGLNRQLYLHLFRKENKYEEMISVLLLLTEHCISLQRYTGYKLLNAFLGLCQTSSLGVLLCLLTPCSSMAQVRLRCQKGIPPALRGRAWLYLSGGKVKKEQNKGKFQVREVSLSVPPYTVLQFFITFETMSTSHV